MPFDKYRYTVRGKKLGQMDQRVGTTKHTWSPSNLSLPLGSEVLSGGKSAKRLYEGIEVDISRKRLYAKGF